MAVILGYAWEAYQYLFEEIPDPRTKHWPFLAKPYQGLTLIGLYLMFVLKWGPKWMKHRPPFNLDRLLIVYNAFQVAACVYLFIDAISLAWGWTYKWICEPVDFSNTPHALAVARCTYYYFLLKVLDLFDTVFFVLRKKFNQVTFLHIYHHTGMVLLIWGASTYIPGGHGSLVGVINLFVHVVMYTYYLLTVAVPSIKNAIWLKKHVTQLQILQFLLCVIHMATLVFKSDCEYPRWTAAVFLPQNLFMLILFIDFYIKTYIKKPREQLLANNTIKVTNQTKGNRKNISINGNVKAIIKNKGDLDSIIDENENISVINDCCKVVNGKNSDIFLKNNNNLCDENYNTFNVGTEKSNCSPDKCKINGNKCNKKE